LGRRKMNKYLNEKITPYVGTESFKLGVELEEVRKILKENKIPFTGELNKWTTYNPYGKLQIVKIFSNIV
jgi:hypothetical protein